jgi:opacity protein-like surface antigen
VAGGSYPRRRSAGGGAASNSFAVKTTWDASIRGRAGYLIDPALLLYGTAGPSWIHVETTSNCSTLAAADGRCAGRASPDLHREHYKQSHPARIHRRCRSRGHAVVQLDCAAEVSLFGLRPIREHRRAHVGAWNADGKL